MTEHFNKLIMRYTIITCLLCNAVILFSQNTSNIKDVGLEFYENAEYSQAVNNLTEYEGLEPDDEDVYIPLGISYYKINELENALIFLNKAKEKIRKYDEEVDYYIASIHQHQGNYSKAVETYKEFLTGLDRDHKFYNNAIHGIRSSANSIKIKYQAKLAYIENPGESINSPGNDFNPVLSPTQTGKIYFSSQRKESIGGRRNLEGKRDRNGQYTSDIYYSNLEQGRWRQAVAIGNLVNTAAHEILQGFNSEGKIMYFFRGPNQIYGKLYADTFRVNGQPPINRKPLKYPADPEFGDTDLHFVNDSILLFSSIRETGMGGYDIYITELINDRWTLPRNAGPSINSSYNDRAAYVTKDLKNLIFSSDRPGTSGGHDLYHSEWNVAQESWSKARNLGFPLNSAGNELFFTLSPDGTTAYFSSDRKVNNFGGDDIYIAYVKQPFSQVNSTDISSLLSLSDGSTEESGIQNPGSETARTEVRETNLPPLYYSDDDVILTSKNTRIIEEYIKLLKEFKQSKIVIQVFDDYAGPKPMDLYFSAQRGKEIAEYIKEKGINGKRIEVLGAGSAYPYATRKIEQSNQPSLPYNKRIDLKIVDSNSFLNINYQYPRLPENVDQSAFKIFNTYNQGLSYRVQVLASRQLSKKPILTQYQNPLIDIAGDNLNTLKYTLGLFKEYNQAQELRKKLIEDGIKGAFIVPYIDGSRKSNFALEQLVDEYPDIKNYLSPN